MLQTPQAYGQAYADNTAMAYTDGSAALQLDNPYLTGQIQAGAINSDPNYPSEV